MRQDVGHIALGAGAGNAVGMAAGEMRRVFDVGGNHVGRLIDAGAIGLGLTSGSARADNVGRHHPLILRGNRQCKRS